ncbi:MAG TPA: MFS transporter [Pseudonocardiaceae bacterium]|nr:MFS transporter [Pseudonocardiaceae bacterium]
MQDADGPSISGAELRRQRRAWYAYGWAAHSFETTVIVVFMSRYLPAVAENAVGKNGRLHVLGIPIAPQSLFAYEVSFCAIVLIFLMPIVGALADRTGRKRELMLGFGYVGALCSVAMWFVSGSDWALGSILLIVGYLTYTCANVVFNSFLPDLAAANERDKVSSVGWALGYVGGGILLALNFVVSFLISDQTLVARISLCSAGVWWALFALVPLRILRNAPRVVEQRAPVTGSVVTAGFRQLGDTLKHLRLFPLTILFLVAYLVYYDGINTVITLAADYGQNALKLGQTTLLSAILIVQFAAFGGALWLGRLADRFGAKRVIGYSLIVWIGVVVAAYFLQAGSAVEFYLLALVLSVVMGGTQALSRSLFSSMIPAGKEAEYFSLYEISSSGSSALGPLVYGLALQETGSYRVAIFSLIVFFVIGLGLLVPLNVKRAIAASGNALPRSLGGPVEVASDAAAA